MRQLRRALADTQRDFAHDTLRLAPEALGELAGILVDFAEDLHDGTGIWAAYERYNTEFFGTALPLTSEEDGDLGADLRPDRFRHFLWVLYPVLHRRADPLADAPGSPARRRCQQRLPVRRLFRRPQGLRREGVPPDPQRRMAGT